MTVLHLVFFKLKSGDKNENAFKNCLAELKAYSEQNDDILVFKVRRYSSPEGLNHGYDYSFKMEFTTPDARNKYLLDPKHEKIKQKILPLIEDVMAHDSLKGSEHTLFEFKRTKSVRLPESNVGNNKREKIGHSAEGTTEDNDNVKRRKISKGGAHQT